MTIRPARTLSARLTATIAESVSGWADLPVLAGIRSGTLDPAVFRNYLEQDYLYLRAYARLYSRLAVASTDDDTLEYFVRLAHGIVAVELDHHRRAAEPFGCDFDAVRPSAETLDYLAFYASLDDDPAGMLVAMLPCIYGYGIALDSLRASASGLYRDWIDIYSGADYQKLVDRHLEMVDESAAVEHARLTDERAFALVAQALELERRFWNQQPQLQTATQPQGGLT